MKSIGTLAWNRFGLSNTGICYHFVYLAQSNGRQFGTQTLERPVCLWTKYQNFSWLFKAITYNFLNQQRTLTRTRNKTSRCWFSFKPCHRQCHQSIAMQTVVKKFESSLQRGKKRERKRHAYHLHLLIWILVPRLESELIICMVSNYSTRRWPNEGVRKDQTRQMSSQQKAPTYACLYFYVKSSCHRKREIEKRMQLTRPKCGRCKNHGIVAAV